MNTLELSDKGCIRICGFESPADFASRIYIEDDIAYFRKGKKVFVLNIKTRKQIVLEAKNCIYGLFNNQICILIKVGSRCYLKVEDPNLSNLKVYTIHKQFQDSEEIKSYEYDSWSLMRICDDKSCSCGPSGCPCIAGYGFHIKCQRCNEIKCNNTKSQCPEHRQIGSPTLENALNDNIAGCGGSIFKRGNFIIVNNREIYMKFSMDKLEYLSAEQRERLLLIEEYLKCYQVPKPIRNIILERIAVDRN